MFGERDKGIEQERGIERSLKSREQNRLDHRERESERHEDREVLKVERSDQHGDVDRDPVRHCRVR
jgi:hypothetical protein